MKTSFFGMLLLLICYFNVSAQVGIGTVLPSAELEIEGTNTGIPTLELNPQSAPTGTADGQLAVIGDKLYLFDATRDKWLSTDTTALNYGWAGTADNQVLWFGGDVELTGPIMPLDGTIVYVTVNSTGGNTTKRMDLQINGSNVGNDPDPTLDGRFNLVAGSFTYSDFNIDFNAGDYITINAANNGAGVDDPVAVIWVKWRE
ncbi:MAG: hypothetical protein AAF489_06765 [Bacteroidota bacterium]